MKTSTKLVLCAALLGALATMGLAVRAEPIVPRDAAQVIETLVSGAGDRAEERKLRRALADKPRDVALATRLSQRYLDRARASGDPRFAGLASAALQPWAHDVDAPSDILLMQATLEQYLHRFDAAAAKLERLVAREPAKHQAWLTLATIRRVQGRYAASDVACQRLLALRAHLYGAACLAENDGLRGRFDAARATFEQLLATPGLDADARNWLATSLAELEQRAGRVEAAEAAWRRALNAQAAAYSVLGYADFLIHHSRHAQALALLREQPRNDAVLLRIAIASALSGAPGAADHARDMRERIDAANLRPEAQTLHSREQAMFALWVEQRPQRAFELALANLRLQAEAIDLLVLAQAARALGGEPRLHEARSLLQAIGQADRRVDALLARL